MMNAEARVVQIIGGGGLDELYGAAINNNWEIDGSNAGVLNEATQFSGIVSLRGGISDDHFVLTQGGSIASIDGGSGQDRLSYIGWNNSVNVDLASRTASGVGLFSSLELFEGQANQSNTIRGANSFTTWQVVGDQTGTVGSLRFQSFDTLIGGSALDRFYMMNAEARVVQIIGGGGLDELYGAAINNNWEIEGASDGVLNEVTRFFGIASLRGGAGSDWFRVAPGASFSGSFLGGSSLDTLDYSAWSSSVNINLATGTATGVSGTVNSFEILIGGSGHDTLTAGGAASVMVGNAGDDLLTSGGLNDILIGGTGNNRLQGGLGSDLLIGGSTRFDSHTQALADLLAEWSSSRTYQQRIDNLLGVGTGERLNGNTTLGADPSDSIFADANSLNEILGDSNVDWFIAKDGDRLPDRVLSGSPAERLDLLSGISR
jgi:Ca2+-binding RTX toxin-like protein